jgi:hypothetical protein
MDRIIVGIIVAACVALYIRRLVKSVKSSGGGCCGSCTSCGPGANASCGIDPNGIRKIDER